MIAPFCVFDIFVSDRFEGRKKFPRYIFYSSKGKERLILAIKYLFEEHLKWSHNQILKDGTSDLFSDMGLFEAVEFHFAGSPHNALASIYSDHFTLEDIKVERKYLHAKQGVRTRLRKSVSLSDDMIKQLLIARFEQGTTLPSNFWRIGDSKKRLAIAIKYLIEEKLKLRINDIPTKLSPRFFLDYQLHYYIFDFFKSHFELFDYVYPNTFSSNQFEHWLTYIPKKHVTTLSDQDVRDIARSLYSGVISRMPQNFWNSIKGKHFFKVVFQYLIEDFLGLAVEDLPNQITYAFLHKYNLVYAMNRHFNKNWFSAIDYTYPNLFTEKQFTKIAIMKKREYVITSEGESMSDAEVRLLIRKKFDGKIKRLPKNFWFCIDGKSRFKHAVTIMFEEYLNWDIKDIPKKYTSKIFEEYRLIRPRNYFFDNHIEALNYVYDNQFRIIDFKLKPYRFWLREKGKDYSKQAIQEMIFDLNIKMEEIPKLVTIPIFRKYGLENMIETLYGRSRFEAIDAVYPGKFKPWEYSTGDYWKQQTIHTAREAVKWLIEVKLHLTLQDFHKGEVSLQHFLDYGLNQMLKYFYNYSYIEAIEDVFPTELINSF